MCRDKFTYSMLESKIHFRNNQYPSKSVYAIWVHYTFNINIIDIYKGMIKLSIVLYTIDEWLPASPHTQGGTSNSRITGRTASGCNQMQIVDLWKVVTNERATNNKWASWRRDCQKIFSLCIQFHPRQWPPTPVQTSHGLGWVEAHPGRSSSILNYLLSTFFWELTSSRCTENEIQTLLVVVR